MSSDLVKAVHSLEAAEIMTATELVLPDGLTFAQYERVGFVLGTLKRASSWWLGDWIIYGENTYGHKYAQAMEATGLSQGHLRNCVSTCSRIPPSRRRADVPFSCHTEVASLKPNEQRRWLAVCFKEGLTQRELRERIRDEALLLVEQEAKANGATPSKPEPRSGKAGRDVADDPASSSRDVPTGSLSGERQATAARSGLPTSYVVPGPLCRRLVSDAVAGRDGYVRVPRDLIARLSALIDEEE